VKTTPKACGQSGCFHAATRGRWCDAHAVDNERNEANRARMRKDVWKLYRNPAWARLKTALLAQGNVVCAKLTDGERCREPVAIFHHLIAPEERPDLMFDQDNVIPLCKRHHPPTSGTPTWKPNVDYAPNRWSPPRFAEVEEHA